MIARGPTFTGDQRLTGSVHILDLADRAAARAFAFEEPGYQAGAYRDVLLRRWHNSLGRSMWDFSGGHGGGKQYLVLGFSAGVDAHLDDAGQDHDEQVHGLEQHCRTKQRPAGGRPVACTHGPGEALGQD